MAEPMDIQIAPPAIDENLDLFSLPSEDVGVLDRKWVLTGARNNKIDADGVIEFNIESNPSRYIDLKNSKLLVNFKILNTDGSHIDDQEEVAPVNLFLASMWKQVDIQLNHENLKGVNFNYGYKAIFDALLNTTESYKKSQLNSQLFFYDNAYAMDSTKFATGNIGWNARKNETAGSKECQMIGSLFLDVFQQPRLLVNGVSMNIKLWPQRDEFRIQADKEYKILLTKCELKVCFVTVNPQISVAQRDVMRTAPAVYPYYRSDIRTYSMAKTEMNLTVENLFNSEVPHKLLVAIVSTEAYNGKINKNPFNFKHYNLTSINFTVNGDAVPIEGGYNVNFAGGVWTEAYLALNGEHTGDVHWGNGIALDDFGGGYAIYVFNVRSEAELKKNGLTKLFLTFQQPLPEGITIIVYGKIPDLFEIDEYNKVKQT